MLITIWFIFLINFKSFISLSQYFKNKIMKVWLYCSSNMKNFNCTLFRCTVCHAPQKFYYLSCELVNRPYSCVLCYFPCCHINKRGKCALLAGKYIILKDDKWKPPLTQGSLQFILCEGSLFLVLYKTYY